MYIISNSVVFVMPGGVQSHTCATHPSLCVTFHSHNSAHRDFSMAGFLSSGLLFTV